MIYALYSPSNKRIDCTAAGDLQYCQWLSYDYIKNSRKAKWADKFWKLWGEFIKERRGRGWTVHVLIDDEWVMLSDESEINGDTR